MLRYVAIITVLGGCLYEEKTFSPPFGCQDDPEPTTSRASATVRGNVLDARLATPISGATLTLLSAMLFPVDDPAQSSGDGSYALTLPLSKQPFKRMYVKVEAAGYVTTYVGNTHPVVDDLILETNVVATADAIGVAQATVGPQGFTSGTGTIFVNVKDCNDLPVVGATITTVPPLRVFYFDNQQPSSGPTATTLGGVTMIADVPGPVSEITINVTAGDVTYRPQTYRVEADHITQVNITP